MDILDTGLWTMLAVSSFLLMVALSALGGILEPRLKKDPERHRKAGLVMILMMLGLCIILALSAIPLMVVGVLGFQEVVGNRGVPAIGFLFDHQAEIIIALWMIILGGSLIAVPAMLSDMKKGP